MHPLRFTIKSLIFGITAIAVAFWGLGNNSEIVASIFFTLNISILCLALVGAVARTGDRRTFWLGFAVFGWVYTLAAFGIGTTNGMFNHRPNLVTSRLLEWQAQFRSPFQLGSKVIAQWRGGGYYSATIHEIDGSQYRVVWDDGSPDSWVTINQMRSTTDASLRVGHAVLSPFIAYLGAVLSWLMFVERKPADADPAKGRAR